MRYKYDNQGLLRTFLRVSRVVHSVVGESFESISLSSGQPAILLYLAENDGAMQMDIATALCIRPATATVNLRNMVKHRLVYKQTDTIDLRVTRVYITERGRVLLKDIMRVQNQMQEQIFTGFSPEERERLMGDIARMNENALAIYRKPTVRE